MKIFIGIGDAPIQWNESGTQEELIIASQFVITLSRATS